MSCILSLDQGTTSSRAIVFDEAGAILGEARREFRQLFPQPGWVEHDPNEIWSSQLDAAREALVRAKISAKQVSAIGIANQRETTVIWDRRTGEPVHNAIVWQDRRTARMCDELKRAGLGPAVRDKTGLIIDAYFSGSKIRWLLDNIPGARRRAMGGELAFGTIDTWLLWKLSNGALHATDSSNASRTLLFNLNSGDWDEELLRTFSVPRELLPQIRSCSEIYTETVPDIFGAPVPIGGVAGDQQAALFGQSCFDRGMVKNTYGTGCFLLMHAGSRPVASKNQLVSTVAWNVRGRTDFALEGSVFIGGAVVQWLRDGLGIIKSSAEIEALARTVPDCGDVYLVPAFAGLGAPHWDQYARGTITGLTRGTTAGHLARAALEGIAFQVADVLDVMRADSQVPIPDLRVDGGAAANDLLLQFQADILQVPVIRPRVLETTALGAAFLAGLAVGFWKDLAQVRGTWRAERTFEPTLGADEAAHRRSRWDEALRRARQWEEHSEPS